MTKLLLTMTTAIGAMGFAGTAVAQETDYCVDYEHYYEETDYFDDDLIDEDEFAEFGDFWYADWDIDDSGYVEEDEYTVCYDAIGWDVGDSYTTMDLDDDGVLNEEEFFGEDAYDAWDLDDNDEIQTYEWF